MYLETVIFLLQILLSLLFLYSGATKVFTGKVVWSKDNSWNSDYSLNTLKLFGVLEILGAIGLIVPYVTNIFPILTPVAATGLAMVMAGAIIEHIRREEHRMIIINIVIIFLLAGVGFERLLEIYIQ